MIDDYSKTPEINVQPLREQIAAWLRSAIFKGVYQQGQELRQEQIASQLNVSRMPVREALQQLANEGLLELRPHRGAVVKSVDETFISETYDIRIMLEGEAAYLATPKLTKEDKSYLLAEHIQESTAVSKADSETLRALNTELHHFIWRKSGNSQLEVLLEKKFISSKNLFYRPSMEQNSYVPTVLSGHKVIIEAMLADNPDAARDAMRRHIASSKERALKHFRGAFSSDHSERLIPIT